jgi:hypothetical protein
MSSFRSNVAPDELCQVNKINKNLDKRAKSCYVLLFQVGELCQVISRGVMSSISGVFSLVTIVKVCLLCR